MRILKKKKTKIFPTVIKLFLTIGIFYFAFTLLLQQNQIRSKRKKLEEIRSNLATQNLKNKALKDNLDNSKDYSNECMERMARERLDLVKKEERVFIVSER